MKVKRTKSREWELKGEKIFLCCKSEAEVDKLINDVKHCIDSNGNLAELPYRQYDVIKIISIYFEEDCIEYIKNVIVNATKKLGKCGKQDFIYNLLNNGEKFNWQMILKDEKLMDFLRIYEDLKDSCNNEVWDVEGKLKRREVFIDIIEKKKITPRRILLTAYREHKDLFEDYLRYICDEYTNKYKTVSLTSIFRDIFGIKYTISKEEIDGELTEIGKIYNWLYDVVNEEYIKQCKYFIDTNISKLSLKDDVWTIFYLRGVSLQSRKIDFSEINCESLKREYKLFLMIEKLEGKVDYTSINSRIKVISYALNFLVEQREEIKHFADINNIDAKKLYYSLLKDYETHKKDIPALSTVAQVIGEFKAVIRFLREYEEVEKKRIKIFYPIPTHNPFENIVFTSLDNYKDNTDAIPDEVMNQLEMYIDELREDYKIVFKIFQDTGLRANDVFMLESDCISSGSNELRCTSSKVLEKNRKNGIPDYRILIISDEVRDLIQKQILRTESIREKYEIDYIFVNDSNSINKVMPTNGGFVTAINRIIEKHNIRNYDGELWRFTSKQCRKTVAENLVRNNATPIELQNQLGHESSITTTKYYVEVEKKKLAELNSEFFRKQFELTIGLENLKEFTEEERRELYVDFRLGYRFVEYGQCTKHFSDTPCSKISGNITCAGCPKCSTGKIYLPKWLELLKKQESFVNDLVKNYNNSGYKEYEEFTEYKREIYFLELYRDIVNKLS